MGHERLSFVHGDIRDAALVREIVEGVDVIVNAAAESHVEKSIRDGRVGVRDDERRGHAGAARRGPRDARSSASSSSRRARSTARPSATPMDEEHPLNPRSPYAATKAGGDRLAYSYWSHLRAADRDRAPVQQLRARASTPRRSCRGSSPRRSRTEPLTIHGDGHAEPRLAATSRTTPRRSTRDDRGAARRDRGRGDQRRDRRSTSRSQTSPSAGPRHARQAALADRYVAERPGQVDRHIGSTDKAPSCSAGTRARLRGGPRAHRRVVSRQ